MSKKRIRIIIAVIFILGFFAGNLAYPQYFNRGVDFLNQKMNWGLPHFWQIPFKLGLDLQGGTHLVYEADLSQIEEEEQNSSMQGWGDVMERRVNFFGVSEPVVQVQEAKGRERLIVELAGVMDPAQAIEEIGKTPFLEFQEPRLDYEEILAQNQKVLEGGEGEFEDPFQPTELTGQFLKSAQLGFDQTTYKPLVLLEFNDEGAKIFESLTEKNIGKPLAIFIDGIPISSPTVQEKIS